MVHMKLGQYEEAIEKLDRVAELAPVDPMVYFSRGLAFLHLGDDSSGQRQLDSFKDGIENLDVAILLNPQYAEAYTLRGMLYNNLGQ